MFLFFKFLVNFTVILDHSFFSNIIEQFIQDTKYDLLIFSWNKRASAYKLIFFFSFQEHEGGVETEDITGGGVGLSA